MTRGSWAGAPRTRFESSGSIELLEADDAQQSQRVRGRAVRLGRVHDHALVALGHVQGVAVELDHSELGMTDGLRTAPTFPRPGSLPQLDERPGFRPELVDQPAKAYVVGIAGRDRPQTGHGLGSGASTLFGRTGHTKLISEESLPDNVARRRRPRREVAEQGRRQWVPREHIALRVKDHCREVPEALEDPERTGAYDAVDLPGARWSRAGEVKQVGTFIVTQL